MDEKVRAAKNYRKTVGRWLVVLGLWILCAVAFRIVLDEVLTDSWRIKLIPVISAVLVCFHIYFLIAIPRRLYYLTQALNELNIIPASPWFIAFSFFIVIIIPFGLPVYLIYFWYLSRKLEKESALKGRRGL